MECKGWQTCTNGKNLLPCVPGPLNQLLKSSVSQVRGAPGALGGELLQGCHPVLFCVFKKTQPSFVYFKKRKEGTVERKCLFGAFFLYKGGLGI